MRTVKLLAVSTVVAAGAFWATMLTSPPQSTARSVAGIDTRLLTLDSHPAMGEPADAF